MRARKPVTVNHQLAIARYAAGGIPSASLNELKKHQRLERRSRRRQRPGSIAKLVGCKQVPALNVEYHNACIRRGACNASNSNRPSVAA